MQPKGTLFIWVWYTFVYELLEGLNWCNQTSQVSNFVVSSNEQFMTVIEQTKAVLYINDKTIYETIYNQEIMRDSKNNAFLAL